MNTEPDVDPMVALIGMPILPEATNTVVATWFTTGTVRLTMGRYIRCNSIRWRQLEDPGASLNNAQMAEVLALAEGWSVCAEPNEYQDMMIVETV
jgi:hypothetical protein